jgi:hypothetical protein
VEYFSEIDRDKVLIAEYWLVDIAQVPAPTPVMKRYFPAEEE